MGKVRFLPANAINKKTTLSSSLSDDASIATINIIISVSWRELEMCRLGLVARWLENNWLFNLDVSKSNQSPVHGPTCKSSKREPLFAKHNGHTSKPGHDQHRLTERRRRGASSFTSSHKTPSDFAFAEIAPLIALPPSLPRSADRG